MICLEFAINVTINDSKLNYNLLNGLLIGKKSDEVVINSLDALLNVVSGINQLGPVRPADFFEGHSLNTRVKGNGNNAVTTPCGQIKTLPDSISDKF